jgi:hypothetical protein
MKKYSDFPESLPTPPAKSTLISSSQSSYLTDNRNLPIFVSKKAHFLLKRFKHMEHFSTQQRRNVFHIQQGEVNMKKYKIGILALAAFGLGTTAASADATIGLYEYAFNFDGNVSDSLNSDPMPAGVNLSGFDLGTGLGTIKFTTSAVGSHKFHSFFDHEIDEVINTYFNDYGNAIGTLSFGQSWEIDEPGWIFGDIYDNFKAGSLDKTNGVPVTAADDVSMAMGWNFTLDPNEKATIELTLSKDVPTGGFYLAQYDSSPTGAMPASIYFSGNLKIEDNNQVPEPATMLLMATGLTGLVASRMRRKIKK